MTRRQLLLDVTSIRIHDSNTGIQRVVRAIVSELLHDPPSGYRVEPVYLHPFEGHWYYRYAREWTCRMAGVPSDWMADDVVSTAAGDVFVVLDFIGPAAREAAQDGLYQEMHVDGARIVFVVYDLLPVLMPEVFPPGQFGFEEWLPTVCRHADVALCISRAVADDLRRWDSSHPSLRSSPLRIDWFHLGSELERSVPSRGLPVEAAGTLRELNRRPTFLMVGTIEPRKGYPQALDAFLELWNRGVDVNLAIVGGEGWPDLPDEQRRNIPETVRRLRAHPERKKRLFWLEKISDEYLEQVYRASTCLIAASHGEGFGLPIVEAAARGVSILARDLPVFREVAGDRATYFSGLAPADLSHAVTRWLELDALGAVPPVDTFPVLGWRQSVKQFLDHVLRG